MSMRVVFMGSAELACACLERLLAENAQQVVVGVVTQPPRPQGRALKIMPCAVHQYLAAWPAIPVLTPANVNEAAEIELLRKLQPDVIVVAAYGQFLKRDILKLPPFGCVNVHASLLPRYRGAAPAQWAIARGETETGVSTIMMNERMDAGDILAQIKEPILPEDTAGSLLKRLARGGAELLIRTLAELQQGKLTRRAQHEALATFAPRLKKSDGHLDWRMPACELHNRVRGFNPWPGCFCEWPATGRIRVLRTQVEPAAPAEPGQILENKGAGPLIQTQQNALRLLEVQPEGRKIMSGTAFLCGAFKPCDRRLP